MTLAFAFLVVTAAPATPVQWDNVPDELARASAGTIDACEVAALPLTLVPGVGDLVGTVAEWGCLVPATVAVDTVAVHFGGRDDNLWQAAVAVVVQKLFEDLVDAPYDLLVGFAAVGAVAALVGSALVSFFVIPGFPIFLPTVLAIAAGALLVAPVALVKQAGGEWIFQAVFFALTNRIYDGDLDERRSSTLLKPRDHIANPTRAFILMSAAAGCEADGDLVDLVPVAGPLLRAGDEAKLTKERMRRVGKDVLGDSIETRDLGAMDATVDAFAWGKGATASLGEGLAVVGAGVGIAGAAMPPMKMSTQATGDIVGFTGLGIALAGISLVAVSGAFDTAKTVAVPLAYGAFSE
jgi:hypothetical protein